MKLSERLSAFIAFNFGKLSDNGKMLREVRDLLDECERVMIGVAYYSPEAAAMMENTLAKLKAQEKADESK